MDRPLRAALAAALDADIVAVQALSGGDVARSYRVQLDGGRLVFAKTHPAGPAHCFTTEAAGLRWLREAGAPPVPEVLAVSDGGPDARPTATEPNYLALAWIEQGRPRPGSDGAFGTALAALHRRGAECFGRTDRRTTGSRGLPNEPCADWPTFYGTQRLLPLARLARDGGALGVTAVAALERLADRLGELGGEPEPPARLHGDLWAGNRVLDLAGQSWLIDPAAHGGHREFDLAMMRLFGGFGAEAFSAYADAFPLADGWAGRVQLHQIAPLVVHAIKFGGAYRPAAEAAIAAYR